MAAAITNAQVKDAVDKLAHRFDLFEQNYESRHEQLKSCVDELDHIVNGNGKEGLKMTMKTLKDDYDQRKKKEDDQDAANRALRNSMIMLLVGQAVTIIISLLVR